MQQHRSLTSAGKLPSASAATMSEPASLVALISTVWSLVVQGQMPSEDVLKLLISKLLGYAIISGAVITKVPQIQLVLRNRSAAGLSFLSFELEALTLLIQTSYGYLRGLPINTYGESVALGIQMLILLALTYRFGKAPAARVMFSAAVLVGLGAWVLSGKVTSDQIQAAFSANTLLYMAARVPQIIKNFASGSTGQLSLVTSLINVVGCVVRVFTSIQEKTGNEMLRLYIIAAVLNGTLVAQILWYSGRKPAAKGKGKAVETKKTK